MQVRQEVAIVHLTQGDIQFLQLDVDWSGYLPSAHNAEQLLPYK